jgi:cobalt-zinc-cadmium resistance protein CzcA
VVPIVLLLILILLFFTFNSFKYALLIFSAVPLSAVGGIAALWIRGMPFSISAGVGFIALFGVAVLNGIVLISYYNQLQQEAEHTIDEIVEKGACNRLRPVLMTASTDILGFLPMALSTSAGAEVQRPLATVVIGGIITATMLTMIMLPVLYKIFNSGRWAPKVRINKYGPAILLIGFLLVPGLTNAQEIKTDTVQSIDMEKAMQIAKNRNLQLKNAKLRVKQVSKNSQSVLELEPTEFNYQRGQINSDATDQYFEVMQEIGSPIKSLYKNKKIQHQKKLQETKVELTEKQLLRDVKLAYFDWIYLFNKEKILQEKVDLYKEFRRISELKNDLGETALLEYTTAETKFMEIKNQLSKVYNDLAIAKNNLQEILNIDNTIVPERDTLEIYKIPYQADSAGNYRSPLLKEYYKQQLKISRQQLKMNKAELFPDIRIGYFNQEINNEKGFKGFSFGISVPLWFLPQNAEIQKAKIQTEINRNALKRQMNKQNREVKNLAHELNTLHKQILYYRNKALKQADVLLKTANERYNNEDIEYYEYLQSLENAYDIKLNYLQIVKQYNKTASKLEFYIN